MDAIEDILSHPAFPTVENEDDIRKKLAVLDLFESLREDIVECRFTVKAEPEKDGMVHYVECGNREDEKYPDRDYVCTCMCVRVIYKTKRILNMLDEINKGCRSGGDSKINILKSLFSCQTP